MSKDHPKSIQNPKLLRFLITYFVLMGLFFLIMGFKPVREHFAVDTVYSNLIVILTHHILSLF